jgi:CRISPR-associated protein Cmr2
MLNLVTLFETVQAMREEFDKNFQAEGMTFSAGIAIAHYKTPLGEVLNYARKMEKKAKDYEGKDAFGMVVMKHSGEILETVLPWKKKNKTDENENPIWNTASLKQIHRALENGVSAAFIKNLHLELPLWENKPNEFRDQSNHEIARYINRAKGNAPEISETIAAVQDLYSMVSLADESNTNFLNALNIDDFLNRKV